MKAGTAIPLELIFRKRPELFPVLTKLDADWSGAVEPKELAAGLRSGAVTSAQAVDALQVTQRAARWEKVKGLAVDVPLGLALFGIEKLRILRWPTTITATLLGAAAVASDNTALITTFLSTTGATLVGHGAQHVAFANNELDNNGERVKS